MRRRMPAEQDIAEAILALIVCLGLIVCLALLLVPFFGCEHPTQQGPETLTATAPVEVYLQVCFAGATESTGVTVEYFTADLVRATSDSLFCADAHNLCRGTVTWRLPLGRDEVLRCCELREWGD